MDNTVAVASGTWLTGAWSEPVYGLLSIWGLIVSGFGLDVKNADLANFYGINALDFVFAASEIAASTVFQANGGFSGVVSEADLVNTLSPQSSPNTIPNPEPGTVLLLSAGLIGLLGYGRRQKKGRKAYEQ
jgi:hypothetical protein